MKEIVLVSGKGGTGKTTLTAAFAGLCDGVLADCDVDASNLPLILTPKIVRKEEFRGSYVAVKNQCIQCGQCRKVCRYNAIDDNLEILPAKCDGCGTCTLVCPVKGIELKEKTTGTLYVSDTRCGPIIHADLLVGEEASGKLVTRVREAAVEVAERNNKRLILIDGPPGVGCPVIASITGTNLVVMVTEPTLSGIHDLQRIYEVVHHFGIPCCVCINKYDINVKNTRKIEQWCSMKEIPLVGMLPYSTCVVEITMLGKTLTEYGKMAESVAQMWRRIEQISSLSTNVRLPT